MEEADPKCANCGEKHRATTKACPKRAEFCEVRKKASTKNRPSFLVVFLDEPDVFYSRVSSRDALYTARVFFPPFSIRRVVFISLSCLRECKASYKLWPSGRCSLTNHNSSPTLRHTVIDVKYPDEQLKYLKPKSQPSPS
ncbi:uncharacterized protein LOC134202680 isoform X2 [Armigeres subalbatus]|uniref:uncharacterized protein LOC134202680 isoform X2 n=1 Tax=Armigeres subalbatus TaxID=124917 RepID=UPI002ED0872D